MDQEEVNSINSDLIRGHIDTIILKALQAGDRYGYDIIKEIEHKSDGQYIIKQPTLYSCLKRLEVQGFVKSYWGSKSIGGRKKYFTLTDLGRELFIRNKNDWDYSRDVINKLISDDDYSAVSYEDDEQLAETTEYAEESSSGYVEENQPEDIEEIASEVEDTEELISEPEDDEQIPLFVEEYEAIEEVAQKAEEVTEETDSEEVEESLPLAAAEQSDNIVDAGAETDSSESDILNTLYDEQANQSYYSNVDNTEYEPSQTELLDENNYFSDIADIEEDEEEVASALSTAEQSEVYEDEYCDAKVLPPDEDQSGEDVTLRRTVSDDSENSAVFYSYKRTVPELNENTTIIDKEYRGVINKLIADNVVISEPPPPPPKPAEPVYTAEPRYYQQPAPEQPPIAVREIEPKQEEETSLIRTHDNQTVRDYNYKRYFYCNQLRLLQFGILFGVMILEIIACFLFIEVSHNKMNITSATLVVYILAVLVAASLPISAFIMAFRDYFKRKRINYSARSSAIFSVAAFILLSLIVFFANVYGGILIGDINMYLSSLIMPIILSTNVIVNAIVFHLLYTSGRYNIN